jgi:ribosome-binding factor A
MRIQRVEALIKHEISNILLHKIADPRIGFATITRVEVSKDIKFAKVYYSVLGTEEERESTKEGLKSAIGFIKKIIGQRLKLKFTPEITFIVDDSPRKSIEINHLLDDLKKGK